MINIDIEKDQKNIKIDGDLSVLFAQLTFVIGFIYLQMIKNGYSVRGINDILSFVVQEGMKKGWEVEKKEKKLDGNENGNKSEIFFN